MTEHNELFVRRLRRSGTLIIFGLVAETVSLFWAHPLAFFAFVLPGAGFVALGCFLFIYAMVTS